MLLIVSDKTATVLLFGVPIFDNKILSPRVVFDYDA